MPSREAMPISRRAHSLSALYMPGKNTASVLSISLYSTSPEMISSSSISSAGRVSTCRSWQATLKSFSRGRKVCPSCRAHCSVYLSPALMRNGESGSKPAFTANLSAVMKPMPSISSISLYGFSFSLAMHSAPYVLYSFMLCATVMPNSCSASMTSRIPFCMANDSAILFALRRPMPGTSRRRSGSFSSTLSVSMPNVETMSRAVASPTPFISPLPR